MTTLTHLVPDEVADRVVHRLPRPAASVIRRLRHEDLFMLSAGLAFYALVSVVPFTMLVLWIVSVVAGDDQVQHVADVFRRLLPPNLDAGRALEQVAGVGARLGVGALLAMLWPASAYGSGLSRAFERLHPSSDHAAKGLRGRLLALALVAVMPALVLGGLVAAYSGTALLGRGALATLLGWTLVLVLGFVASTIASAVIYKLFSPRPLGWRAALGGGTTAGACISILSAAYVVFLHFGTDFEHRYATSGMAAVVLLGLWLFLANALILVGYQVAAEMNGRADGASPLRRHRSIRGRFR
ncbi:MAG: YihY/virulence factor BrkB family protein [Acidimicrobiales bacterium]